jgi:hypothetical protein
MPSAIVRVEVGDFENESHSSDLHRLREHIAMLKEVEVEGVPSGIPSVEIALNIIRGTLARGYPNGTSRNIIHYVFRIHLLTLARKEKLDTALFQKSKRLSTQEICSALYDSAKQFPRIRKTLGKVDAILKPKNVQSLIDKITVINRRNLRSKPPQTIRRAPAAKQKTRISSYA